MLYLMLMFSVKKFSCLLSPMFMSKFCYQLLSHMYFRVVYWMWVCCPIDLQAALIQGFISFVLADNTEKTDPTVKVFRPSSKECRNQKDNERKKTILCVASKFYPDHISVFWQINGKNVSKGVATDNAALKAASFYSITSRLRVSAEDWFNPQNNFTCTVSFFTGNETRLFSDVIYGEGMFIWNSEITQT